MKQCCALFVEVDGKCPWSYDRFWVCADQSACVGRWALCNNVRECRDDSDEADCEGVLPIF